MTIARSISSFSRNYCCQLRRLHIQLGLLSSFAHEVLPRPTLTASNTYRSPNPPKAVRLISIMPPPRKAKRKLGQFVNDTIAQAQASPKKLRQKLTRNPVALMSTMATATVSSSAANDDGIDYQSLALFVEQQMKDPKPITPLQRRALTDLTSSLKDEEPDTGGHDWISLLQRYIDAHKARTENSIIYKDEAISAAPSTKWNCILIFSRSIGSQPLVFPQPEKLVQNGFAKKKDAKKYAAKCCVEWLMAEEMMPKDGKSVTFPHASNKMMASTSKIYSPLSSQPSSPNPHAAAQGGHSSSATTTPTQSSPSKPPPPPKPTDSTTSLLDPPGGAPLDPPPDDEENDTAPGELPSKRVAALCEKLGFRPPRYVLIARAGQDAVFDGHADMGPDSWIIPDGVGEKGFGRVEGVYGRKFAKDMVAQNILGILEQEERRRGGEVRGVLGG
ncbi:rRNA-processing protein efg1 [Podospora bellae-mahoneyi]|uniref:rRNA-processing protein efg1 n=1 Tax=Podospora bellae-mahoneyi TaxID=2093777 RepID=A0ABR0F8W7_9PEZI|nr:rRNA-processing protein efg1 [Podospora bellae-mahoneyi]